MMDLVLLGLFAFWLGKNIDGFDFDFSQNPQELEPTLEQDPAVWSNWVVLREEVDAKYPDTTYRLEKRTYSQNQSGELVILITQYRILENGEVFRTYGNTTSITEVQQVFREMIRPRTEAEQAEFERRQREKAEANASQNQQKEREQSPPLNLNDPSKSRNGGVM